MNAQGKKDNTLQGKNLTPDDLGLTEEAMKGVVTALTRALADTQVIYVKTLNIHWNIVGPDFYGVHILLDAQYNELKKAGDKIAERIRSYGVPVIGSMSEFLGHTGLQERKGDSKVDVSALNELVKDHEAIMRQLREDIDRCSEEYKDEGAADLLIAQIQQHQEMAWMLRAFLQ